MSNELLLDARGLVKSFPGVQALKGVSLQLKRGEIHGVIGQNGAGKSTLVRLLSGRIAPDSGTILVDGATVTFHGTADAIRGGIGMVPQELVDFAHLSVADNLYAGHMGERAFSVVNRRKIERTAREYLRQFDVTLDPRLPVGKLTIGHRQVLQILRTVALEPRLLILDEPTASLDVNEAQDLFRLLRRLNEQGVTICYISHRLRELFGLVQRVTVLRDGRTVGTRSIAEVGEGELVRMMVGRELTDLYAMRAGSALGERLGEVCLEVKGLSAPGIFRNVSFSLREGEILGFFGLIGAGRSELFRAILGLYRTDSGEVRYRGRHVRLDGMKDAVEHSIAYLPEDRKRDGLFTTLRLHENLIAPQIERFSRPAGMLKRREIDSFALRMMREMNIVAATPRAAVATLSGGNQQKVLLGMWAGIEPHVLIADEPTKGVDVATKQLIYLKLRQLADAGVGIALISSDLPEVIHLADRIIVMREGSVAGELNKREADEELMMGMAVGLGRGNGREHAHG